MVSVVLPVYNNGNYILQAVNSILAQTLSSLELIVVNDGSTDQTASVLSTLVDPRFILLNKPHSGVIDSLNHGIAHARGEFFARMDGDDIALPERLALELSMIQDGMADVVGGQVRIFRQEGELQEGFQNYERWTNSLLTHEIIVGQLFIEDPIPSPTLMMRMGDLKRLGGYDDGVYPEDYHLTLKIAKAGLRFAKVPQPVLEWRDHEERMSRNSVHLRDQRFFDLKARYFRDYPTAHQRPLVIWGLGKNGKALFKALQAQGVPVAGFTASPEYLREPRLYNVPVQSPEFWKKENAFFLLSTAARSARLLATQTLESFNLAVTRDFLPFC